MKTNKAEKVLRDIENLSEKRFLPIVGREKGQVLETIVKRRQPKKILEHIPF